MLVGSNQCERVCLAKECITPDPVLVGVAKLDRPEFAGEQATHRSSQIDAVLVIDHGTGRTLRLYAEYLGVLFQVELVLSKLLFIHGALPEFFGWCDGSVHGSSLPKDA